ncbi:hypothetical protein [Gemmatimonas sp.]|uniref:hypothetical protein n=1 Tax=Gemmatimonas sp. TaxID=1962908 RepID=UPI0039835245
MTTPRARFGLQLALASALTVSLAARTPTPLSAQMGGMGGGMGGRYEVTGRDGARAVGEGRPH